MSFPHWLLGSFAATVVLTTVLAAANGAHVSRISLHLLLGTMVTPQRNRARSWGLALHALNGWLFGLLYVAVFHGLGTSVWWLGGLAGLVHAGFALTLVLPALPSWHPRMASAELGSTVVRQLEPPGFLAMHYGAQTPGVVLLAHVLYGIVLAAFYGAI